MAHFAKIENGIVENVIVISDSDCGGGQMPESEGAGQSFILTLGLSGSWLQTSYNRNFRGLFAGIGLQWNGSVFYGPSTFPSWVLNDKGTWDAPSSRPEGSYRWDEDSTAWVEVPE